MIMDFLEKLDDKVLEKINEIKEEIKREQKEIYSLLLEITKSFSDNEKDKKYRDSLFERVDLLNIIISIIAICFVDYLNDLIKLENNMFLTLIMVFVILFLFLYFTYMTFRNLNHLVNLEKNRIIKNKRGNNNENR